MVQIGLAFYNNVLMPIGILLLASTAIVPLTRWGSAPSQSQKKTLLLCALLALAAPSLAAYCGWRHPVSLAIIGLAALAVCTTLAGLALDAWRHSTTRHLFGIVLMLRQRRRLYCGYAIHLAIACIAIGIAGSSLGARRHDADLNEGDVVEWAGRRIEYLRLARTRRRTS
jgi:cytochrome c-type biogenesis protein CcmF